MVTALSIKVEEPVFESQTKTKLGSKEMSPDGVSIRNFIGDFLKKHLDNYLHKHPETADILLKKIIESEKERKAISGIQKLARERAKKSNLHNRKLRDCKIHLNDNDERRLDSTIFITEGDSASGSITTSRDVSYPGSIQPERQAAECIRTYQENRIRKRGVQPAAGSA